jgi:hypothetical protein
MDFDRTARKRATPCIILTLIVACAAAPVHAQQPSQAQTNAIRQNCRSDFQANCSGVQPGGKDALACLQKNVARLSPGCQTAVKAIGAPAQAAPVAPAAPSPAPPAVTAAPSAPAVTAAPPSPTAPAAAPAALPPPAAAAAKPPAAPAPVVKRPAAPKAPAAAAAAPAMPAPPPPAAPALSAQEEQTLIRQSCALDYRRLCRGTPIGGGRVIACLAGKAPELSPACQAAIKVARPR